MASIRGNTVQRVFVVLQEPWPYNFKRCFKAISQQTRFRSKTRMQSTSEQDTCTLTHPIILLLIISDPEVAALVLEFYGCNGN